MNLPRSRQELEQFIIGMIISNPMNYHQFNELLEADMFLYHKDVFEYCETTIKEANNPDLFEIGTQFGSDMIEYFWVNDERFSFKNIALLLTQEHKKELILRMSNELISKVDKKDDLGDIIQCMQCYVSNIATLKYKEPTDIKVIIKQLFDVVHNNMESSEYITGVHTGYPSFDAFTGGWQGGDLIIVGGEAGQGKTSLAIGGVVEAAIKHNEACAIFSLEMSQLQLVGRIIASYSGVSVKSILRGKLTKEEYAQLNNCIRPIEDKPIYIDPCFSADINYICSQIRTLVQVKGVKIAVIDYIQLVSNYQKGRSQEQELSGISRALKLLALELGIPIILLAQLRREQGNPEPALNRLKGSGAIEQDADIVLFPYRPEAYEVETIQMNGSSEPSAGKAKILWKKGRNIGITDMLMNFNGALTKFTDVDYSDLTANWQRLEEQQPEPKIHAQGDSNTIF